MSSDHGKLIVMAVGGNSLILDEKHKSVQDQYDACEKTCVHIVGLLRRGHRVVVTHGNGPQVGFILRRSELARQELHEVPLDSCGADSQGAIGYQIQRAMHNMTKGWDAAPPVATVVTQVLVDHEDPSFRKPSKPIGSFMGEADAKSHRDKDGWNVLEDAGRGWRRVVASPRPVKIMELDAIKHLIAAGVVVIAVGGGGIPVVKKEDGTLVGADAVIDKDLATSLLARELKADVFVVSTAVEKVYVNFRKPDQKAIDRMTVAEARKYLADGHFAPGSMKPKIEAAIEFIEASGGEAVITDPPHLVEALDGLTGTRIVP
jgi:carbamate kinase